MVASFGRSVRDDPEPEAIIANATDCGLVAARLEGEPRVARKLHVLLLHRYHRGASAAILPVETPHQWIGQQVKSGFIEKFPRPTGKDLYVATHKAVEELSLQEEASALVSASDETFTTDWDSPEDNAYDRL